MILDDNGTQSRGLSTVDVHAVGSPEIVVPILRAGVLAEEFCKSVALANVEAVFERCFYLRSGGEFICVGQPDIRNGPLTLIGNLGRLPDLALQRGQSAAVCDQHIVVGSIRLTLDQT